MDLRIGLLLVWGLFVGSFLNVLIYRLPRGEHWVRGRSRCPKCKHDLAWLDLIPVVSFVWLRGKCRYCGKPIAILYPIVELANGLFWSLVGYGASVGFGLSGIGKLGWTDWGLVGLITTLMLCSVLLVILVVDWQHYVIPDEMVGVLAGVGVVLGILEAGSKGNAGIGELTNRLIWGLGAMGFFWLLHLITKGKGMGFGDVKLVAGMGLVLEKAVLVALMSAFMIGAIVGVALLLTRVRKLKQPIPFGPFLVMGMVIGLLTGNQIINWYLVGLML